MKFKFENFSPFLCTSIFGWFEFNASLLWRDGEIRGSELHTENVSRLEGVDLKCRASSRLSLHVQQREDFGSLGTERKTAMKKLNENVIKVPFMECLQFFIISYWIFNFFLDLPRVCCFSLCSSKSQGKMKGQWMDSANLSRKWKTDWKLHELLATRNDEISDSLPCCCYL